MCMGTISRCSGEVFAQDDRALGTRHERQRGTSRGMPSPASRTRRAVCRTIGAAPAPFISQKRNCTPATGRARHKGAIVFSSALSPATACTMDNADARQIIAIKTWTRERIIRSFSHRRHYTGSSSIAQGDVEGGLRPAKRRAAAFICCKRHGSSSSRVSLWASVGRLLTFTPAPFSRMKSLLRVSWPGTGLAIEHAPRRGRGPRSGQPARLGDHDVGRGHQFVDLRG